MLPLSSFLTQQPVWKKLSPLLGSSAVILAAMIAGKAASFVWRVLMVRYDLVFLGEVEVFSTTLGLAVTFSTLAFPAALTRFALRQQHLAVGYLVHAFFRLLLMFGLVGVAVGVLARISPLFTPNTQLPIAVFLGLVLVVASSKLALGYLNSQKKFTLYGLGEYGLTPVFKLILFLGILGGVWSKAFLFPHVVWSTFIGALMVVLATLWLKRKQPVTTLAKTEKKQFLSYSLFLSSSFLTFMVYGALDVYLLQYFFGSAMVGVYAGLLTLINLSDVFFLPFLHTFPAHLADKKTRAKRVQFTEQTGLFLLKLGLVAGVGLAGVGALLLPIISNNALQTSFWILLAFVVYKALHLGLVHVYRHYLDFQGEQAFTARTMAISLVVKSMLCLLWVPPWGIAGLAAANIATDGVHVWLLRRKIRFSK